MTGMQVVANYIPSANDRVQVEGHFVTDGVCVAVTTLAQSSSCLSLSASLVSSSYDSAI